MLNRLVFRYMLYDALIQIGFAGLWVLIEGWPIPLVAVVLGYILWQVAKCKICGMDPKSYFDWTLLGGIRKS